MSDWGMELMQGYGVSSTDFISGISSTRRATQSVTAMQSGDRVSLSEEAMRLAREMLAARQQAEADAAQEAGSLTGDDADASSTSTASTGGTGGAGGDSTAKQIEELQKKIEQLQQQISQVEQGAMPDGVKESVTRPLYQQINELQQQINELQAQAAKQASGGGGGSAVSYASLGKSGKPGK